MGIFPPSMVVLSNFNHAKYGIKTQHGQITWVETDRGFQPRSVNLLKISGIVQKKYFEEMMITLCKKGLEVMREEIKEPLALARGITS